MSARTAQAFVIEGGFSAESRKNPAMKWIEDYTNIYDKGLAALKAQFAELHTSDYTFVKADGSVYSGVDKAFEGLSSVYGPLPEYHHQPTSGIVLETDDGYQVVGHADVYYNLPGHGTSAGAEDTEGKSWDGKIPGAFTFTLVKSSSGPNGLQLSKTVVTSDSGPIILQLLQRGVISPAQLGL